MHILTPKMIFVIVPLFVIVFSSVILWFCYFLAAKNRNLVLSKLKKALIMIDPLKVKWHWAIGEKLQKPLDSDKIESLFKKKKIKQNTRMWVEGQNDWNEFNHYQFFYELKYHIFLQRLFDMSLLFPLGICFIFMPVISILIMMAPTCLIFCFPFESFLISACFTVGFIVSSLFSKVIHAAYKPIHSHIIIMYFLVYPIFLLLISLSIFSFLWVKVLVAAILISVVIIGPCRSIACFKRHRSIPATMKKILINVDLQETKWYWAKEEILQGPLDSDQVEMLFKQKKIKKNTKIWVEGQDRLNDFDHYKFFYDLKYYIFLQRLFNILLIFPLIIYVIVSLINITMNILWLTSFWFISLISICHLSVVIMYFLFPKITPPTYKPIDFKMIGVTLLAYSVFSIAFFIFIPPCV